MHAVVAEKLSAYGCKNVDFCVELLMNLQYNFPITRMPFDHISSKLGTSTDVVIDTVRRLHNVGVIKRIGFYYNVRSAGRKVALVAFKTDDPDALAVEAANYLEVTHNYLRDCEEYNLWIVARANSDEELRGKVENLKKRFKANAVILWALRTYRLSVKFDLEKGISRAGYMHEIPVNPPKPEELGYSSRLASALRSLPIVRRPFNEVGARLGYDENYVLRAASEMLKAGILADPGAALDGHKIGFNVNVMYTLMARSDREYEKLCSWIASNVPYATHIVYRSPDPSQAWRYKCFFMVHAVEESLLKLVDEIVEGNTLVKDYLRLKSLKDFTPGIVR